MSMLSQAFYVNIDRDIIEPGHSREVLDFLNAIDKRFILQLIPTVQLSASKIYDT